MRIIHTVEFYHPFVGGAELVVRRISEGLRLRGHEVTVVTSAHRDSPSVEECHGVRVVRFGLRGNAVKGVRGDADAYQRFLLGEPADVVMNYAAQSWPTDLALPILNEIDGAKVLAACGYSGLAGWRRPFYNRYFRRLPRYLAQYDRVIYHSARYRDKIFADRNGLTNSSVIPNGVDLREFTDSETNADFVSNHHIATRHLIVSVSNHYRIKGHRRLVKAFRNLRRRDVTLAILGRAPEGVRSCAAACRRSAAKDPRIVVIDDPSRAEVVAAHLAADAFVLGSHVEAFPLVVLEAMASGTPFVSFDVGAVAEMPGGIVVRTPAEMTVAIDRILGDSKLGIQMASDGRAAAQRYDWDRVVDQYERLYFDLVARRQGGQRFQNPARRSF